MDWASLLAVILSFLGPLLKDWLDNLLKRAAASLESGKAPVQYGSGADAERAIWNRAEALLADEAGQLAWYQWLAQWQAASRKRTFLAARRSAERRAGQFYAEALGGNPVLHLSPVEIDRIEGA